MRQRFTFIKTNEVEEDFQEEERVELESVIEDTDIESLEKKFENFLLGCGHEDVTVTIEPRIKFEQDGDHLRNTTYSSYDDDDVEDLEDELEDVNDNVTKFSGGYDESKPSDTE